MFIDATELAHGTSIDADLCIVGAGAAGITMALELSQAGHRVCLMEAGGLSADDTAQSVYAGQNVGLDYTPLEAARIRYFGGTTNHWSGWCWPLDPLDFEQRDWIPHSGWPINRHDLDPYYQRAQPFCDIGDQTFDVADWQSAQEPVLDAAELETRVLKFSEPTRFGLKYQEVFAQSNHINTYLNASLISLQADAHGTTIASGEFNSGMSQKRFTVNARQFVLAAGGIENAKLLLQSRDSHEQGLGNQHDVVGRYFADHPGHARGLLLFNNPEQNLDLYKYHRQRPNLKDKISDGGSMAGFFAKEADRRAMLDWIESGADEVEYQRSIAGIVKQSCLQCHNSAGIAFFRNFETFSGVEDVALRPPNTARDGVGYSAGLVLNAAIQAREGVGNARTMLAGRGTWGDLFEGADMLDSVGVLMDNFSDLAQATYNRSFNTEGKRTIAQMRCAIEPAPNPDSRVTLADALDPFGQPQAKLDWRLADIDKKTFARTEEHIGNALGRNGLGRLLKRGDLEGEDWANTLNHGWHHMGTTRMHSDPRYGVVDKDCRVHGMSNLYIAGSSVFPTYGYANPTLTIIALAIRLADKLAGLQS